MVLESIGPRIGYDNNNMQVLQQPINNDSTG